LLINLCNFNVSNGTFLGEKYFLINLIHHCIKMIKSFKYKVSLIESIRVIKMVKQKVPSRIMVSYTQAEMDTLEDIARHYEASVSWVIRQITIGKLSPLCDFKKVEA
jgi:hypothetical protein